MLRGSWEIVPFSFVIDWFAGVGTWLTSLRDTNLEVEKSYATTVVERRTDVNFDATRTVYWTTYKGKPFVVRGHRIDRVIDISPPTLPVFANQMSFIRLVDAISLILGMLKSMLR